MARTPPPRRGESTARFDPRPPARAPSLPLFALAGKDSGGLDVEGSLPQIRSPKRRHAGGSTPEAPR